MTGGNCGASFDKLAIVVGANGDLGHAYVQRICAMPGYGCVGLSIEPEPRSIDLTPPNYQYIQTNMSDAGQIQHACQQALQIPAYQFDPKVTLIYALGTAKLELDRYCPETRREIVPVDYIEPRTWHVSVLGLRSMTQHLISGLREKIVHARTQGVDRFAYFRVVMFGSVFQHLGMPFFRSRSNADTHMHQHLLQMTQTEHSDGLVPSCLHIKVSPINSQTTRAMWPFASEVRRKNWMDPMDLVDQSLPAILDSAMPRAHEITISKVPVPDVNAPPPDYHAMYHRLARESGYSRNT